MNFKYELMDMDGEIHFVNTVCGEYTICGMLELSVMDLRFYMTPQLMVYIGLNMDKP